jgi:hypothetical protein
MILLLLEEGREEFTLRRNVLSQVFVQPKKDHCTNDTYFQNMSLVPATIELVGVRGVKRP